MTYDDIRSDTRLLSAGKGEEKHQALGHVLKGGGGAPGLRPRAKRGRVQTKTQPVFTGKHTAI